MKGLLSIGLLFCLVIPFLGAWQFLSLRILQIKEQVGDKMEEGIEQEQQVLLKFTKEEIITQLDWEHSKEFEYKGEMYDVISSEVIGDTTWYWCFWDKKETALKKEQQNLILIALGQNPQQQKTQNHITNFLRTLFPITPLEFRKKEIYFVNPKVDVEYCFSSSTFHPLPPFHPPEFI